MDIEKKQNSKLYRFFDWLYKLLVMNVFTIMSILPIVTAYPAIVAMYATIKNDMKEPGIFKIYFSNYKKYFLKSLFLGLIIIASIAIVGFAFYFYAYAIPQDSFNEIVFQMGVAVMILLAIVIIMLSVHIPLITITFNALSVMEIIRTSFFISFRYFITTLILFVMFVLSIVGIIALPIWFLFGVSLPTLLGIKFTSTVYYKFEQIDLESILQQAEDDLDE